MTNDPIGPDEVKAAIAQAKTLIASPLAVKGWPGNNLCRALLAESARADRLHEALKRIAVVTCKGEPTRCQVCGWLWSTLYEQHKPDCLGAPKGSTP